MSDILFDKDIVRKVSSNLGIEEDKIKNLLDFFIYDLKKTCDLEDTYSVMLPKLGALYIKYPIIKRAPSGVSKKKKEYLKDYAGKEFKNHFKTVKIKNRFFTKNMTFSQLQYFQNEEEK